MDDTIENELAKYITKNIDWESLPTKAKLRCSNNKKVWEKMVVNYSVKHQLSWSGSLVGRLVHDQKRYYAEVAQVSRRNLLIYPYHLQEEFVRLLKVTPFQYYYAMMTEVMQRELSYDTVPNFTAADGRRLLGIGRNQYIDAMNKTRAKTFLGRKKFTPKDLLPTQPVDPIRIQYWWCVRLVSLNEKELEGFSSLSPQEKSIIEILQRNDNGVQAGRLPYAIVESFFKRGYIFIEVPIEETDRISIPPLDQFVMNRLRGDYFERLLYTIFFAVTESTTVLQLAGLIQNDLPAVQKVVSLYCRLGFAHKLTIPRFQLAAGWDESAVPDDLPHHHPPSSTATTASSSAPLTSSLTSGVPRIGLVYDEELTAFLMMGNLGSGLKAHAVTMFERGKVSPLGLKTFMAELEKIPDDVPQEGEVIRYYLSALALRSTLIRLTENATLAMLRSASANDLPEALRNRVLSQQYDILISFCPVAPNATPILCAESPHHFGCPTPAFSTPWWKLFIYQQVQSGPPSILFPRGLRVRKLPSLLRKTSNTLLTTWQNQTTQISPASLLPILNESLITGPVLVQAIGHAVKASVPFCPHDLSSSTSSSSSASSSTISSSLKSSTKTTASSSTTSFSPLDATTPLGSLFDPSTPAAPESSLIQFDLPPVTPQPDLLLVDFNIPSSSSSTITSSSSSTITSSSSSSSSSATTSTALPDDVFGVPKQNSQGFIPFSPPHEPFDPEIGEADERNPSLQVFGEDDHAAESFAQLMSEYTGIHHVGDKIVAEAIQSREFALGQNIKGSPVMRKAIEQLGLSHSIGYVQFFQHPNDPSSCVIYDIQFGLPLYDRQLNEEILSSLTPASALSTANLQAHSQSMQALSDRLSSFMRTAYPDSIYVFSDGVLHQVPSSAIC